MIEEWGWQHDKDLDENEFTLTQFNRLTKGGNLKFLVFMQNSSDEMISLKEANNRGLWGVSSSMADVSEAEHQD